MNLVPMLPKLIGWIGFYNPWLLLWGLGIAIPIAIHFWRRPAKQEIPWAAMRFLDEALRLRSKRFQVEQWILLAIRCMAMVILLGLGSHAAEGADCKPPPAGPYSGLR